MRQSWIMEPGDVFGRLTVLNRDFEKEAERRKQGKPDIPYYRCQCTCNNVLSVMASSLRYGNTQSCGCLRNEQSGRKPKDLNNKTFGDLTVLEKDNNAVKGSGKHAYWLCKCSLCGAIRSYRSSDLIDGKATCSCQIKQHISNGATIDLTGRQFGHLSVLERDISRGIKSGQHAYWFCKCDICGRIESVGSYMLLGWGKDRCKYCGKCSFGEAKIIDLLERANIQYTHDQPYGDCIYPGSGGRMRFDFCVSTDNNDIPVYMIEYDGEQHYRPAPGWDKTGYEVEDRQKRDAFKNQWCGEHGIPLLRIPYTRRKKLNLDDLMLETTTYRVV